MGVLMWLLMNDGFLSIVRKDCGHDELLVRARRPGDIEKMFPHAKVVRLEHADYLYRAVVSLAEVVEAISAEVDGIDYPNFKDSTKDPELHAAYNHIWCNLLVLQQRENPWWNTARDYTPSSTTSSPNSKTRSGTSSKKKRRKKKAI
jgi:hypothetical protein